MIYRSYQHLSFTTRGSLPWQVTTLVDFLDFLQAKHPSIRKVGRWVVRKLQPRVQQKWWIKRDAQSWYLIILSVEYSVFFGWKKNINRIMQGLEMKINRIAGMEKDQRSTVTTWPFSKPNQKKHGTNKKYLVGMMAALVLPQTKEGSPSHHLHMGVSKIGVPQNEWFAMENPIKMDDLGVPLFSETSIYRPSSASALQTRLPFNGANHALWSDGNYDATSSDLEKDEKGRSLWQTINPVGMYEAPHNSRRKIRVYKHMQKFLSTGAFVFSLIQQFCL